MKRDRFLQQKSKDMLLLSEKEKRVATIKKNYSCFGERVLNIMLSYAASATGLSNLMKKLGIIPKDKDEETIHAEIVNWIYTFGEPRFLSLYKEQIPKELSSQKGEPVESLSTSGDVSPVLSPAIKSKPSREAEKKWSKMEHRSGKDRRVRKARRKDVDVIFKNKRFGGERRSGKDRRKNWKSAK